MKKNILVLNDGSQYENWGIKACIDGVKNIFDSTISSSNIIGVPHSYMHKKYSYDPIILGRKVLNDNSRVAKKILSEYHLLPKIADEFDYVAERWLCGKGGNGAKDFIEKIKKVDIVVFNAEGSTYRDNIGAIKGLFMLWLAKTKFNKKAYFINGSVTLTAVDATLPAIIRKVFSIIDGITVREPYSKKNIIEYYPELSNVQVSPDSVFSLPVKKSVNKQVDISGEYFCFSLSMLPMDYRRTRSKSALVKLIKELKKIVPQAVLLAKDIEDQILKDLAEETNSIFVGASFDYDDVMELLKGATFLLSGRYHHLIFATKVGCPVIPIATSSHKIHGLSELFSGLMPFPVDATDIWSEYDNIIALSKNILESSSEMRNSYLRKAEELSKRSLLHGKIIENKEDIN